MLLPEELVMRLALFGGTFDPIHNAHLTVAREAADQFHLEQVWFIPAAHPPHKTANTGASYEDRFRMTELACEADPRFVASLLEAGVHRGDAAGPSLFSASGRASAPVGHGGAAGIFIGNKAQTGCRRDPRGAAGGCEPLYIRAGPVPTLGGTRRRK
jgi:cytidyltransferase-like protein